MGKMVADIARAVGLSVRDTRQWLRKMGVSIRGEKLLVNDETLEALTELLRQQLRDIVPAPPKPPTDPIERVMERHADWLMSLPRIVGVDIGEDAIGQPYLGLLLSVPPEQVEGIPKFLDGYPVRLIYTGRIVARAKRR